MNLKCLFFILLSQIVFSQTSGILKDSLNHNPIPYANIWIKNTLKGGTTDENGKFSFNDLHPADTLIFSSLGYQEKVMNANQSMEVFLVPSIVELQEVIVTNLKETNSITISEYEKAKKKRELLSTSIGFQYSIAKYFPYLKSYSKTPFLNKVNFITSNNLKRTSSIKISVVEANSNGKPSTNFLAKNLVIDIDKGLKESTVELLNERITFSKNGIFIFIDRLYIDDNKLKNKYYTKNSDLIEYSFQPAIGLSRNTGNKNTWWYFGGNWFSPSEISQKFAFANREAAINLHLTN